MSGLVYEAHSPLSFINDEETLLQTVKYLFVSVSQDFGPRVK